VRERVYVHNVGIGSQVWVLTSAHQGRQFGDLKGLPHRHQLPQSLRDGYGIPMLKLMSLETVTGFKGFEALTAAVPLDVEMVPFYVKLQLVRGGELLGTAGIRTDFHRILYYGVNGTKYRRQHRPKRDTGPNYAYFALRPANSIGFVFLPNVLEDIGSGPGRAV